MFEEVSTFEQHSNGVTIRHIMNKKIAKWKHTWESSRGGCISECWGIVMQHICSSYLIWDMINHHQMSCLLTWVIMLLKIRSPKAPINLCTDTYLCHDKSINQFVCRRLSVPWQKHESICVLTPNYVCHDNRLSSLSLSYHFL